MTFVGEDAWHAIEFAEFAENGAWPVAGGVLDQAHVFVQACRFIWSEQRALRPRPPRW